MKEDELVKMRAGLDQMGELMKEVTPLLRQFYLALQKEGFSGQERIELTKGYMLKLLGVS